MQTMGKFCVSEILAGPRTYSDSEEISGALWRMRSRLNETDRYYAAEAAVHIEGMWDELKATTIGLVFAKRKIARLERELEKRSCNSQ